jgi:hypothetical protein
MDLLVNAIVLVVGFGAGAAFYRYTLKRDPAKLDAWSAEIKAAQQRVRDRIDSLKE